MRFSIDVVIVVFVVIGGGGVAAYVRRDRNAYGDDLRDHATEEEEEEDDGDEYEYDGDDDDDERNDARGMFESDTTRRFDGRNGVRFDIPSVSLSETVRFDRIELNVGDSPTPNSDDTR